MTTRAEEIAAKEYPECNYRNMGDFMRTARTAFVNGYKQGHQDRWISVKDRVPEDDRRVLVTDGGNVIETRHNGNGFKMPRPFPAGLLVDVTHWCELPSPPNPEQR